MVIRLSHRGPRSPRARAATLATALTLALGAAPARADLWCAAPLWVHEWGVHVFGASGLPVAATDPDLPSYFHTQPPPGTAPIPVRHMPADNGVRKLPVLHFYTATPPTAPIPIGLEVGFTGGPATAWLPEVDTLRHAESANGPAAAEAHAQLVAERAKRAEGNRFAAVPPLPPDPTRQLIWDRLELTAAPYATPASTTAPWVTAARAVPGALWVNHANESDRFVFYEAKSSEHVALIFARTSEWTPANPSYAVINTTADPIHDIFIVHREPGTRGFGAFPEPIQRVAYIGSLAPKKTTRVVFSAPLADPAFTAATADRLRATLLAPTDPTSPAKPGAPTPPAPGVAGCVTDRDPAIPFEQASDHHLFAPEVDLLLQVWTDRFFRGTGTTIVYREDPATLARVMPVSIYADMHTFVNLSRAGLALWEHAPW